MAEERVLSEREQLIQMIEERLVHTGMDEVADCHELASLIGDDVMRSLLRIQHDTVMLERGRDAGFEKGLREAIAAVGEIDRNLDHVSVPPGEYRLVDYQEAQLAIAKLSNHGMEDLFTGDQHDPYQGGIVPPYLQDKIKEHKE